MPPSSRTPEGVPNRCPVCGAVIRLTPSMEEDAPCPNCGHLVWFSNPGNDWENLRSKYLEAIALAPSNLAFRQSLRGVEYRMHDDRKPLRSAAALLEIRKCVASAIADERWVDADQAAEEGLVIDPFDVELNVALGDAAAGRCFRDIAIFAYKCALSVAPNRVDVQEKIRALNDAT